MSPTPPKDNHRPTKDTGFAVKALYDYVAADKDEVSFIEGDVIVNCQKVDEGWMTGTVQRTLTWGMLPANYVEKIVQQTGRFKLAWFSVDNLKTDISDYVYCVDNRCNGAVIQNQRNCTCERTLCKSIHYLLYSSPSCYFSIRNNKYKQLGYAVYKQQILVLVRNFVSKSGLIFRIILSCVFPSYISSVLQTCS